MKKTFFTLIILLVFTLFASNNCLAIIDPPIVSLPYTFTSSNTPASINIDGDEDADFYIEYYGLMGGYYFMLHGLGCNNFLLAEWVSPPSAPLEATAPLTEIPPEYTSILPFGTEIYCPGVASPLADAPLTRPPSGPYWVDQAIIVWGETGLPPVSPLTATTEDDVFEGYFGVSFTNSGGRYNAWLHVSVDEDLHEVTIFASGMGSAPDEPVMAGEGAAVPVPFIASVLGIFAIGAGVVIRRRKKK